MPKTFDDLEAASSSTTTARMHRRRKEKAEALRRTNKYVSTSNAQREGNHWGPIFILNITGTSLGGALVGGMLAGPAGALGGTAVGIGLGLFLQKSHVK